jgi:hypothetical protein
VQQAEFMTSTVVFRLASVALRLTSNEPVIGTPGHGVLRLK